MISLAIPFYNTSNYLEKILKTALNSKIINQIIIHDDCSNFYHKYKLNNILRKINSKKIFLFRNKKNLGGFANKYLAVKRCSNKFIYLLDSDNFFDQNFDKIFSRLILKKKVCYCPQQLIFVDKRSNFIKNLYYKFSKKNLDIKKAKNYLIKDTKNFDWFLNTGNFVVSKNEYLQSLKLGMKKIKREPHHACSIAFSYYWLKNRGFLRIVKKFYYFHRLRKDSYWNSAGKNAIKSSYLFKNKIINS